MKIHEANKLVCVICKGNLKWWCETQDWEYFTSTRHYTYHRCENCGTIFLPPLPEVELRFIYPDHYYSYQEPSRNIVFRIKEWLDSKYFYHLLKKIPGNEINILDVGGGNGRLLSQVKSIDQRIRSTTIVDINEANKSDAEKKGHVFHVSRMEDFESDNRYDLILMLNLIEHVNNPGQVLNKVSKLLTNTGICLIKTPNGASWDANLFRSTYWGGLHCPRHWTIFTPRSFRQVISDLPLTIIHLQYTQGAPFWAYSILVKWYNKELWKTKRPLIEHPLFAILSAFFAVFDWIRSPFFPTSQLFIELKKRIISSLPQE